MGEELFSRYPEMTAAANKILRYSVEELCLTDRKKRLHQTRYTQPALYVVNALTYMSRRDNGLPPPDFVAGHSLGEFNALLAAEALDFETGLRLVIRRGALMARAPGGGMAAVIGCDWQEAEEILRENGLLTIDVANYNSPSQLVLSGPTEDLARAEVFFSRMGATYKPLKVSAAFHSRYMEPFLEPLGKALEKAKVHPPKIPVISNVSARPHDLSEVKHLLKRQIREPVQWAKTIHYLLSMGVREFEEVGPGSVLTKLIRSIRRQMAVPATVPERGPVARQGSGRGHGEPSRPTMRRQQRDGEHVRSTEETTCAAGLAIVAERLGAESFRRDYKIRRAYIAAGMVKGITSKALAVRMGKAGYMGFFGAGGLRPSEIEESIISIREALCADEPFGVSLLFSSEDPGHEDSVIELCLRHDVRFVEAAGYVSPSRSLIRYRLKGLSRDEKGELRSRHKVIARVSRPEVADAFLNPPSEPVVADLLKTGQVDEEEAQLAERIPVADDLCVETDSGGLMGALAVLLPTILRQRDEVCRRRAYERAVRVGSSGEIGTPEAAAAAFLLGSDFIATSSINQCTVEAEISEDVKDILQTINVQDTEYAPRSDLFELGAKVQVLRKGVLFPARANRLYDLWRHHGSWEEIDGETRKKIERDYLERSFAEVYAEIKGDYLVNSPQEIEKAERDERHRMALVFRWYLNHAMDLALAGAKDRKVNYQVHCGSALGAFNQWVKGTELEQWQSRHVDVIADRIMDGAAHVLNRQLVRFAASERAGCS